MKMVLSHNNIYQINWKIEYTMNQNNFKSEQQFKAVFDHINQSQQK